MPPLKLYKVDFSPPARAAMMCCEILKVPTEMINIDVINREHLKPDYLKKNPTHSVPLLEDGNLILHDSHAILMYLADTYGDNDAFYPKDVKRRALVNQKLFFDTAILFPRLRNVSFPTMFENLKAPTEKQLKDIDETYKFMEEFLSRSKYIAGDDITIADISTISNITTLVYILPLDAKKYPKTHNWIKEMENQPYCKKYNEPGVTFVGELLQKCWNSK